MKRGSSNLHQFPGADEQTKAKLQHQMLLNDYVELLKESVSKKRKLRTVKQKRDDLLAQVKFLRHRRRYLLEQQCLNSGIDKDLPSQNSTLERPLIEKKRNFISYNGAAGRNSTAKHEEEARGRGEEEEIVQEALRIEKAPRNYLTHTKRIGKKKIMWQDQRSLKV